MAVPLPLSTKVTRLGSVPVSDKVGVGEPVVVTVKVPAVPTVNVVPAALAIAGAVPPLPAARKATNCMIHGCTLSRMAVAL